MDLETALARYIRHHNYEGHTKATIKAYRSFVGEFLTTLGGGDVDDLGADDLRAWVEALRDRGNAQHTVKTKVAHVKTFGKWLATEGYLKSDPFVRVAIPKADSLAKPTLTPEEVTALLAACNARRVAGLRNRAMLLTMYSTAVRASELLGLAVGDLADDQATVRRGKGGKFRIVPLAPKVRRSIDRYLDDPRRSRYGTEGPLWLTETGEAVNYWGLKRAFQVLEDRTGIHCNPHKWRHSSAVQYLRNGGRLEVLQKLLGHSTLTMTLHYARLAGVDVLAAHVQADPARSIKFRG